MQSLHSSYPKLVARPVGKQIHNIYVDRLRQFTDGGQYKEQGLMGYVTRNQLRPESADWCIARCTRHEQQESRT